MQRNRIKDKRQIAGFVLEKNERGYRKGEKEGV